MAQSAVRLLLPLLVAACVYVQHPATATPRFEVAAVKPCVKGATQGRESRKGGGPQSSPDRLHLPCQTLMALIQWAWVNFADNRFNPMGSTPISGGPDWIRTDLFTIEAKAERPESWGTLNGPMLRELLKERFRLQIHSESRETPAYALTVAKSGARLQASTRDCVVLDPEHPALPIQPEKPLAAVCGMGRLNGQGWDAFAVTMRQFARLLSDYSDRKVVDRTGLSGTYDVHLNLSPEEIGVSPDAGPAMESADVFARVRASIHRLGLRLEPAKAREDLLVIDRADSPSIREPKGLRAARGHTMNGHTMNA